MSIILIISTTVVSGQGLKFTPKEKLNEVDNYISNVKGYAGDLPSNFSLEKYVPPVLEQQGATCVGYAAIYYGLSAIYNQELNRTGELDKLATSFDPYFLYSIIQNSEEGCDDGLFMPEAFELLTRIGSKKTFYPPFLTCNSSWELDTLEEVIDYTHPYRINNFYQIDLSRSDSENLIKEGLNYGFPVVIGVKITKSLYPFGAKNTNGIKSDGLWSPSDFEGIEGGHAMTIIGYDDKLFGGAFRVVNSWGKEYGDNGYIWIKYSDLNKYVLRHIF